MSEAPCTFRHTNRCLASLDQPEVPFMSDSDTSRSSHTDDEPTHEDQQPSTQNEQQDTDITGVTGAFNTVSCKTQQFYPREFHEAAFHLTLYRASAAHQSTPQPTSSIHSQGATHTHTIFRTTHSLKLIPTST